MHFGNRILLIYLLELTVLLVLYFLFSCMQC